MLTRNDSLRSTRNCYPNSNTVKYIVVHYTGCMAPAKNFCLSQMNNDLGGSAHDFVDDNSWYNAIEHKHGAWAVGGGTSYGPTNYNTLNIEMVANPWQLPSAKTIANTVEIVAYYMKVYNIPIDRVVRHYDCNSIRKPCPYGMEGSNNAKWNEFKKAVLEKYNGKPSQPTSEEIYRVRKDWNDPNSQIGAYKDLNNAITECKKHSGYEVYNSKGQVVYPTNNNNNNNSFKVQIVNAAIYVIDTPSPNGNIVTTVYKGEVFTIVEVNGNYGRLKSGAGWINLNYTKRI